MLLIVLLLIALVVVIAVSRARVPGGVDAAQLGWVSQRWLAEYRASHQSQ
jgi:hypothetical protein